MNDLQDGFCVEQWPDVNMLEIYEMKMQCMSSVYIIVLMIYKPKL